MNKPLVSINCITYNHAPYIKDALDSFLMQETDFDFEILIHDDASTDGTQEIIKEYEKKYPDVIKPVYQTENQHAKGVKLPEIVDFNHKRALGKYIAFCEGDDYWTDSRKLQKQFDIMEKNPAYSLCTHAANIVDLDKNKTGEHRPYQYSCEVPLQAYIRRKDKFFATDTIFYRKKDILDMPQFFFDAIVGDVPLMTILGFRGKIYYIDEYMSEYRVGSKDSWTVKMRKEFEDKNKQIEHHLDFIKLIKELDEYSDFLYHEDFDYGTKFREFNILLVKNDLKTIKSPEYRGFYDELSKSHKIKLNLKCRYPNLYEKLKQLKNRGTK